MKLNIQPKALIIFIALVVVICAVVFITLAVTPRFSFETNADGSVTLTNVGNKHLKAIKISEQHNGKPVTSIGSEAFKDCSSLASITLPNSVTSIGNNAFHDCNSLTSVTLPNSVTSIGNNAFFSCSSLESVTVGNSVTSIGAGAFYGCDSLTSITIPDSVTSVGVGAFSGCRSLASITFNGTVAQWEAIDKGDEWNSFISATCVHCSDGDANID